MNTNLSNVTELVPESYVSKVESENDSSSKNSIGINNYESLNEKITIGSNTNNFALNYSGERGNNSSDYCLLPAIRFHHTSSTLQIRDEFVTQTEDFNIELNYSSKYVWSFAIVHSICGIYYGFMENILNTLGYEILSETEGKKIDQILSSSVNNIYFSNNIGKIIGV